MILDRCFAVPYRCGNDIDLAQSRMPHLADILVMYGPVGSFTISLESMDRGAPHIVREHILHPVSLGSPLAVSYRPPPIVISSLCAKATSVSIYEANTGASSSSASLSIGTTPRAI